MNRLGLNVLFDHYLGIYAASRDTYIYIGEWNLDWKSWTEWIPIPNRDISELFSSRRLYSAWGVNFPSELFSPFQLINSVFFLQYLRESELSAKRLSSPLALGFWNSISSLEEPVTNISPILLLELWKVDEEIFLTLWASFLIGLMAKIGREFFTCEWTILQ